ncbi:MAG: alpha/beta fold hydrolase [Chloroflexota bacterium]|jgi:pimeloyl-ACP methyl ester carboxylesterase
MKIPIAFECHGDTIRGAFHPAEEALSAPIVLLLRGFPPYEDSPFADRLTKRDIHVVTIDFRGALQSDGVFTLSNVQEDIQAAIAFLQQDGVLAPYGFDADQLILGGTSFGGGMALAYAVWHPEIKRIFSLAGNDFGDFARQYKRDPDFASMTDAMFEELWTSSDTVRLGNRTVKELLDDPRPYDLRLNAPALADRDILLIGGWDDHEVTIEDRILPFYRALKEAGAQTVQIAAVQDDHSFEKCGQEVVELIVRWLKLSEPS